MSKHEKADQSKCRYCSKLVRKSNMKQHELICVRSETSSGVTSPPVSTSASSVNLSNSVVEATENIMELHTLYSIGELCEFLRKSFPEIPQEMRSPIILAATTAARRAAVLHNVYCANFQSQDPTKRVFAAEAHSSLSFWALGLRTKMRFERPEVTRQDEAIPATVPAENEVSDPDRDEIHPTVVAENLLETREVPVPLPTRITDAEFLSLLNAGLSDSLDHELLELVPVTTDTGILELSVRASTPGVSNQPENQMSGPPTAAVDKQRMNKDTPQLARDQEVVQETCSLPAAATKRQTTNDASKVVKDREMERETSTRGSGGTSRHQTYKHGEHFAKRRRFDNRRHLPSPPLRRRSRSPAFRHRSRGAEPVTLSVSEAREFQQWKKQKAEW